jgi:subtilisin family serine protease
MMVTKRPLEAALVALALLVGSVPAARIQPELASALANAGSNQKLAVSFVMKEQAEALTLDPNIPNLPKPERRARVGRVLMDFAASTQHDLLDYLQAKAAEGEVDGLNSIWIVNEVACFATRDVILDVANRTDVADINYDLVPVSLGTDRLSSSLKGNPPPRDAVEPNLNVIQAPAAWRMGYTGQNVVVGEVDTGIWYTHMDLRNHLWTSPAYPHCGFNYASHILFPTASNPSPYDTLDNIDYSIGHGTFCAGIASADGSYGNGTHDTMGVAPSARMLVCCALVYFNGDNSGETLLEQSVLLGLQFCVRPPRDTLNGADVITTSLGVMSSYHPRLANYRLMERDIAAAGLADCVSAGGGGPTPRTITTPATCPPPWPNPANNPTDTATSAVITVGCTDNNDSLASFSSVGPTDVWGDVPPFYDYVYPPGLTDPDVCAPGVNVYSTYWDDDSAYAQMSGTSFSTPAVAGCVALILSKNPNLTPREIDSILECCAVTDLGDSGKDDYYGAGRINCSLAVAFTLPAGVKDKNSALAGPRTTLAVLPNPFRDRVTFSVQLSARDSRSELRIYGVSGQLVRELAVPQSASRGSQRLTWDGTDRLGRKLPNGIYLVRLVAGERAADTKRVLLVR